MTSGAAPAAAPRLLAVLADPFSTATGRWLGTAAVLVGVFAASVAVRRVGGVIRDRYDPRGSLLEAAQAALIVGLSVAAIAAVLGIWNASEEAEALVEALQPDAETVIRALVTLFVFLAAWGATVFASRVMELLFEERDAFSRNQQEVGYHLAQVGLYLLAVVAAVAVWGINLGNLLIGAGFLSVVVGLAARQTLSSVLAGFVLLFGRPFDIGDWIAVADHEGVVTDVSIFNTELRTYNGEYVTVPNDVVTSQSLVNRSRRGRLRVDVPVGVDYDDDPDRARAVATEAMRDLDSEEIRSQPEPETVLTGFGDSAVTMELRFWVDDPTARRRWAAQTAVVQAVKEAFEAEDLTIPFPQRTVGAREGAVGEDATLASPPGQEEP